MLFTVTLVLQLDPVTPNDVTSRSPTNSEFTVKVHGRPILCISITTEDPGLTDPLQLLIILEAAKSMRTVA